jgi:hypothetical protein
MAANTYLHISGVLAENMVYRPRPGHESPRRGRPREGNPDFQLVLLDREGRVLVSVAPQVTPRGCGSADDPQQHGVRGVLPLHPDAVAYELRRGEIRLYGAAIPGSPPPIAAPTCHEGAGSYTLKWHPVDPAPSVRGVAADPAHPYSAPARCISYTVVAAMESGRRITVARGLKDPSHTVDTGTMPVPGKGTLYLVASDGVRSSEVKAASIEVAPRPPTPRILMPAPGGPRIPFGQALSVLGCCLDMGGQPCPPEHTAWYLDGQRIASGTLLAAHDGLQPGPHRLTFAFEPADAERVEASVTIEVGEPDAHYRQWEALMNHAPAAGTTAGTD